MGTAAVLTEKTATPAPPAVLGLQALGFVAGDADLGPRFLALSGLDPAGLRAGAQDTELLAAVIAFLAARDGDLIACADAIGVPPETLARAGAALAGEDRVERSV